MLNFYKNIPTIMLISFALSTFAAESENDPQTWVKPNPESIEEWRSLKYGMFIHYGMSTFSGRRHKVEKVGPEEYAPTQLDVEQWVRVARDAGMKYIVLTAKHVAGHCLWDSKVEWQGQEFAYDVASSTDKTDVIAAFVAACKKYDIEPGLYYCFEDYVNNSNYRKGGPGRKARIMPEDYFELVKLQLAELLTQYPDVEYIWLDIPTQANLSQRTEIYKMIKEINKDCLVLYNWGVRKEGAGSIEKTAAKAWPRDMLNTELNPLEAGQFEPQQTYQGETYYVGYEHCDTIATHWFWEPEDELRKKSQESDLAKLYEQVRGAGGNLLLNVPPDRTGQIPDYFVEELMALKKVIDDQDNSTRQ